VDGGALMHETKPLAFSFLIEKELEKGLENLEKEIENFNIDFDFDF
jgi:hypothetical protein